MRLLLDQNLSFKLCARLADLFPGSTHAAANGFALVTQDADFAEMAALYGPPPKVIWLRGGNRPTAAVEGTLRRNHILIRDFAREDEATCLEIV